MTALPPDLREAVETVRSYFCPNWPHPGIIGCVYCIEAEERGAPDAIALIEQRLMEYERVVEAYRVFACKNPNDSDYPTNEALAALDSPKEKP